MNNNAVMQILQMARGGQNPAAYMRMMAQNDPRMAQAMQLIDGKDTNQLRTVAENLCRQRGVDMDAFARQFGLELPK